MMHLFQHSLTDHYILQHFYSVIFDQFNAYLLNLMTFFFKCN